MQGRQALVFRKSIGSGTYQDVKLRHLRAATCRENGPFISSCVTATVPDRRRRESREHACLCTENLVQLRGMSNRRLELFGVPSVVFRQRRSGGDEASGVGRLIPQATHF